jgi:hypothetical protein
MVAYTTRMPAGIAGNANRQQASTIERQVMHATLAPTVYGVMTTMDSATGTVRIPATGDLAATGAVNGFYGFLVRPYPTGSSQDALGVSTPMTAAQGGEANILKRGYMTVRLYGVTTAAKGQQVNVSLTAAASDVAGGVTTTVAGTNILAVPNCYFMGPAFADPNNAGAPNIVEIAYNI